MTSTMASMSKCGIFLSFRTSCAMNRTSFIRFSGRVGHRRLDVQLVAVPPDPRAERRVHRLDAVDVARRDEDEVGGDRLGLHHRSGGALRLADDRELAFLEGGEEGVLALDLQEIDLVQEQDAAVRLVDRADLDPLVGRGLEPTGLERVVLHVAEEGAGVRPGRVDERRLIVRGMRDEQLGDPDPVATSVARQPHQDVDQDHDEEADQERGQVVLREDDVQGEGEDHHGDDDEQDRALLLLLRRFELLGGDVLLALARKGRPGSWVRSGRRCWGRRGYPGAAPSEGSRPSPGRACSSRPGSPMRIMCRFWVAAFRATSTASSWPMTCSSRRGGTST